MMPVHHPSCLDAKRRFCQKKEHFSIQRPTYAIQKCLGSWNSSKESLRPKNNPQHDFLLISTGIIPHDTAAHSPSAEGLWVQMKSLEVKVTWSNVVCYHQDQLHPLPVLFLLPTQRGKGQAEPFAVLRNRPTRPICGSVSLSFISFLFLKWRKKEARMGSLWDIICLLDFVRSLN